MNLPFVAVVLLLLGAILLVLGVFAVGVFLLAAVRRRRLAGRRDTPGPPLPDAWAESGRRLAEK